MLYNNNSYIITLLSTWSIPKQANAGIKAEDDEEDISDDNQGDDNGHGNQERIKLNPYQNY